MASPKAVYWMRPSPPKLPTITELLCRPTRVRPIDGCPGRQHAAELLAGLLQGRSRRNGAVGVVGPRDRRAPEGDHRVATNLSIVPPYASTVSLNRSRYWFSTLASSSGSTEWVKRVKPSRSVNRA